MAFSYAPETLDSSVKSHDVVQVALVIQYWLTGKRLYTWDVEENCVISFVSTFLDLITKMHTL